MSVFLLYANKNQLIVRRREPVTSGSVNVYRARFEFSPDWEGLKRKAVFIGSGTQAPVTLDETGECYIPWEVCTKHGWKLMVGVFGSADDSALPTVRADLGTILEGVSAGDNAGPAGIWEQRLEAKGDRLDYTQDGELGLYTGDRLLSSVPVKGGEASGTADHRALTHRDEEGQHPIESISGLAKELERIPAPTEALTNFELEELLK